MADWNGSDRNGGSRGASFTPVAKPVDALDRQVPQSVEAERAVLGSILLLPEVFDEVALILRPGDFYDSANRQIFEHLLAMHDGGQRIDLMLLVERLKKAEAYEATGGAAYLAEIGRQVPTAAHAEYYAKIVADKALLRSLIHVGMEIQSGAYDPTSDTREMLSKAEERVFSILENRGTGHVTPISEVLQHSLDRIDARMEHESAFGGVETGFIDFDQMTGGLQKSELIILAARPSMGKTALAMNMAEHAALSGVTTLFVSLEMAAIELGDRLLCSVARVNGNRLRNGTITHDERRKLINAAAKISQAPLFIDDSPSRTMTEISANARRLKRSNDLGLIVIDYLQLIDPDNSRDPRQEQVSKISRRLKGLAREMQVPVLCLGQLNRQVESSSSNKPQLSHLRESGAIEQDADIVMFVHRDEYYMTNEEDREQVRGQADLLIRKNRSGPVGEVKLTWSHEFTRFENFAMATHAEFDSYAPSGDF